MGGLSYEKLCFIAQCACMEKKVSNLKLFIYSSVLLNYLPIKKTKIFWFNIIHP